MIAMSGTDARDKRYRQRSGKGAGVGGRYKARVGRHADRLRNLFFTYVLLARAVAKASDMLVRHITAHELPGLNPRILGGSIVAERARDRRTEEAERHLASSPKGHRGIIAEEAGLCQVSHDYGVALQDEADGRFVQQRMKVRAVPACRGEPLARARARLWSRV